MRFIAKNLPQPKARTGRPIYTNLELLPGILLVLRSGCRWRDLNRPGYPSGVTHWRRLRYWKGKQRGRPKTDLLGKPIPPQTHFGRLWEKLLQLLAEKNKLDTKLLSIDGTVVPSFNFRERVNYSGKAHTLGVKLSTLVDGTGIPLAMNIAPGSWHDARLAVNTIENVRTKANLFGSMVLADRGYDSFQFRHYLSFKGLQSNIPRRKCTRQVGQHKKLYCYHPDLGKARFVIERTNAWIKSFKRLHHRVDRSTYSFECFVLLAIIVICVRRLIT